MGVVRIDDELETAIEQVLSKDENKYRYPSKTAFLNLVIYDALKRLKKKKEV